MRRSLFGLALVLGALTGCNDVTAPEPVAGGPSRGLLSSLLEVTVLQRLRPVEEASATATITPAGGSIRIPSAGFTIRFPEGAVRQPVTIRATAIRGRSVAYRFEPHGLVFAARPTITQELGLTEVVGNLLLARQLEGGYFTSESLLGTGSAIVSETQPATTSLLGLRTSFQIAHFSGYVVASGRKGGYISSSGTRIPLAPRQLP